MDTLIISELHTKKCRDCGETKSTSEYYVYSGKEKHMAICKDCARAYTKRYHETKGYSRIYSAVEHERLLIDVLHSKGIFAVAGKQTRYTKTDVVAWGCVRIEAKLADSGYRIGFSRQQVALGVRAEIIAVIIPFEDDFGVYLVPANHPMFEQRKERLSVHPAPSKPSLSIFSQLKQYRDNWEIIEEYRVKISSELASGEIVIPGVAKVVEQPVKPTPEIKQLAMF